MEVFVGLIDAFEYNDENYYSTEGCDVYGVFTTEEDAREKAEAHFRRVYTYLAEQVSDWQLSEFLESISLPPPSQPLYEIPAELKDRYMDHLAKQHVSVQSYTVQS